MSVRTVLSAVILGSSLAAYAAPSAGAPTTVQPVKLSLARHELKDGAKPRARARLVKGHKSSKSSKRLVSEPLQDYYKGTDLQYESEYSCFASELSLTTSIK